MPLGSLLLSTWNSFFSAFCLFCWNHREPRLEGRPACVNLAPSPYLTATWPPWEAPGLSSLEVHGLAHGRTHVFLNHDFINQQKRIELYHVPSTVLGPWRSSEDRGWPGCCPHRADRPEGKIDSDGPMSKRHEDRSFFCKLDLSFFTPGLKVIPGKTFSSK